MVAVIQWLNIHYSSLIWYPTSLGLRIYNFMPFEIDQTLGIIIFSEENIFWSFSKFFPIFLHEFHMFFFFFFNSSYWLVRMASISHLGDNRVTSIFLLISQKEDSHTSACQLYASTAVPWGTKLWCKPLRRT